MESIAIKFPAKKDPEFITELRNLVASYFEQRKISKYGNANLVWKSVFMFSLYLIPYFLMLSGVIPSFGGVFVCWVVIGIGKAGVGMAVMHDANHHAYSKVQAVNRWLGRTLYLLGGFPSNWQYQHNTLHHGFTNIEGHDEDISTGSFLRISPHRPLLRIHRYQYLYAWFLYGLMTLSWVTAGDFAQLNRYRKRGVPLSGGKTYFKLFFTLVISKLVYYAAFLLLPMLMLPFAWYWTILFFLVMHFTTGLILAIVFQTAHVIPATAFPLPDEKGVMENNWAMHQLLTTSDFAPQNRILSWLIGGLNYQVEHHLFPNISHVHYPQIAKLVEETAHKYGLPYHVQPGFLRAVSEHARMLWLLGRGDRL